MCDAIVIHVDTTYPISSNGRAIIETERLRLAGDAVGSLAFLPRLKMIGVGFKASVNGNILRTYIGLSHDVCFLIPEGLKVVVANDVDITISGNNRNVVMQFAKTIRNMKKPEPYKGKGIFLNDEKIIRKEGKKK